MKTTEIASILNVSLFSAKKYRKCIEESKEAILLPTLNIQVPNIQAVERAIVDISMNQNDLTLGGIQRILEDQSIFKKKSTICRVLKKRNSTRKIKALIPAERNSDRT